MWAITSTGRDRDAWSGSVRLSCLTILLILGLLICWSHHGYGAERIKDVTDSYYTSDHQDAESDYLSVAKLSTEDRLEKIENTLESVRASGDKAEERSYFNKMTSIELIRYVKIMVVVLILIAVVFPITIWLMSRKRLLGLSGLSTEVTATLLIVEERQAKLANILKEIQEEIDYMHTMSAADLKKLIEQAEKYLKQNEIDLERAGSQNINKKV